MSALRTVAVITNLSSDVPRRWLGVQVFWTIEEAEKAAKILRENNPNETFIVSECVPEE